MARRSFKIFGIKPSHLKLFIQSYYLGGNIMASVLFNQDGISPTTDVETINLENQQAYQQYQINYLNKQIKNAQDIINNEKENNDNDNDNDNKNKVE